MMTARPVFFVSDRTGLTVEQMGLALLGQFGHVTAEREVLRFVDSAEKARRARDAIEAAGNASGGRPLVFITIAAPEVRAVLVGANALVLDVLGPFLDPLAGWLGRQPAQVVTRPQVPDEASRYHARMNAVQYALATDDGLGLERYDSADVILVGVSRSGKTPTCLYLALMHGLRAANWPLTPEDLDHGWLPPALATHREKLVGLLVDPQRLQEYRAARDVGEVYGSRAQCEYEARAAAALLHRASVPCIESGRLSVEEIAAAVRHALNHQRRQAPAA